MGWLITLGVLVLLAVLPLGVRFLYDSDGPLLHIVAGPLRIKVFPSNKEKQKKEKTKKEKKTAATVKKGTKKKGFAFKRSGGNWRKCLDWRTCCNITKSNDR